MSEHKIVSELESRLKLERNRLNQLSKNSIQRVHHDVNVHEGLPKTTKYMSLKRSPLSKRIIKQKPELKDRYDKLQLLANSDIDFSVYDLFKFSEDKIELLWKQYGDQILFIIDGGIYKILRDDFIISMEKDQNVMKWVDDITSEKWVNTDLRNVDQLRFICHMLIVIGSFDDRSKYKSLIDSFWVEYPKIRTIYEKVRFDPFFTSANTWYLAKQYAETIMEIEIDEKSQKRIEKGMKRREQIDADTAELITELKRLGTWGETFNCIMEWLQSLANSPLIAYFTTVIITFFMLLVIVSAGATRIAFLTPTGETVLIGVRSTQAPSGVGYLTAKLAGLSTDPRNYNQSLPERYETRELNITRKDRQVIEKCLTYLGADLSKYNGKFDIPFSPMFTAYCIYKEIGIQFYADIINPSARDDFEPMYYMSNNIVQGTEIEKSKAELKKWKDQEAQKWWFNRSPYYYPDE